MRYFRIFDSGSTPRCELADGGPDSDPLDQLMPRYQTVREERLTAGELANCLPMKYLDYDVCFKIVSTLNSAWSSDVKARLRNPELASDTTYSDAVRHVTEELYHQDTSHQDTDWVGVSKSDLHLILERLRNLEAKVLELEEVPLSAESAASLARGIEDVKAGRVSPLDMSLLAPIEDEDA